MNKKIMTILAMLTAGLSVFAQPTPSYTEKEVFKNDDVVFRQIDAHTWEGNGHLMALESLYIIEGNDKAILLDAGTDIKNLDKIAASITSKPITLIATHVHPDHTGASIKYFPEIYINPADTVNMPEFMPDYKGKVNYLKDGEEIDLGGRKIKVIFTPGHTPGSTSFVDKEAGYGFSGDSFGSGNLLVSYKFSALTESCKKMDAYITENNIKYLYPGHYMGVNKETPQRIKDLARLSEEILTGKRIGEKNPQPTLDLDLIVIDSGVRINYNESKLK